MTNMNPDHDYSNLATALRFALRQGLKDIYTCMPGIVRSYDPESRRATVQAALSVTTTDGREIERASVADVPVVFPTGGGFSMTWPLEPGDSVLLVYARRGLSEWKRTLDVASPDLEGFFSEKDAIAIPGFVHDDTEHRIDVSDAGISLRTPGVVAIEAEDMTFKQFGSSEAPMSVT